MSEKELAERFLDCYHSTGWPLIVTPVLAYRMRQLGIAGEGKTWHENKPLTYDTKKVQRKAPVLFPLRRVWPAGPQFQKAPRQR